MGEDHKGDPLGDVDRHIVQNAGTGYLVLAEIFSSAKGAQWTYGIMPYQSLFSKVGKGFEPLYIRSLQGFFCRRTHGRSATPPSI